MKDQTLGIYVIIFCTLITSSAQILLKKGANVLFITPIYTNWALAAGLGCYIVGAGLMIYALKKGEVSVLYPIFATSYIWVTIISAFLFGEPLSATKIGGVALVVLGISLVSRGSKKTDSIVLEEVV